MNYVLALLMSACVAASEPYEVMFVAPRSLSELEEIMDKDLGSHGQMVAAIVKNLIENKVTPVGEENLTLIKAMGYCDLRFNCYHKSKYYKSMFENARVGNSDLVQGDGLGILVIYAAMKHNNKIGSLTVDPNKEFKWQSAVITPITALDLPDENSDRK